LAPIVKYISGRNYIKRGFYLLAILICIDISAQTYRLNFENTRLSDALVEISKQFGINIAFDAEKLASVKISKEVSGNTPDEILRNILINSGFEYQFKHNSYLITEIAIDKRPDEITKFQIIGTILDKENGELLPFATINIPESNTYTLSTNNGTFYFNYPTANNTIHITISYIGYTDMDTILNLSQSTLSCQFKLNRKTYEMKMVEVKENKLEMIDYRNDVDFATTINPSKLSDLPVLAETDIFRALQLLPGISYRENSSELNIRGGSGDQNLILFDGLTLYNLSHYFGVFSSLNPNVIKDIQVYKGGYDSRYGERVSGIVDITGKSGNQLRPTIYGDINLLSANIAAEIPIGKKITFIAAGRRSYSDIYATEFSKDLFDKTYTPYNKAPNTTFTESEPQFNFYDYNFKMTYRLSNLENIAFSAFRGKDYYNNSYTTVNNQMENYVNEFNTWGNYGYNASWIKHWNGAFFSNFQAGTSGYTNEFSDSSSINLVLPPDTNKRYLPNPNNVFKTYNNNKLSDISFSTRNILYINNNHQLNFGALIHYNSIYYHKDADNTYIYDNTYQSAWNFSVYGQDRIKINNLSIKPGLRLSLYGGNNNFYLEPRFAVNYKISEKASARFATGRFHQFISQVLSQQETGYNKNFWVLANDSIHPVIKSNHFILGASFEFGNFLLDAEAYYKNYSGLQEYLFISPFRREGDFPDYFQPQKVRNKSNPPPQQFPNGPKRPSYFIEGTGISKGIDISLHYKLKIFNSWISYSFGKSSRQFPDINNNKTFPAPADQTHQLSWANMLTIKKWNFGTTTLFSTGRPYISNNPALKDTLPITRTYVRTPNYFRSDFTVNYNFIFNKIRLKTGVTLINLFNTSNHFDINTREYNFENVSFTSANLIRAQNLSLNLFLHFAF
jgi:hypothetical protein